jgi:hypothetical protein
VIVLEELTLASSPDNRETALQVSSFDIRLQRVKGKWTVIQGRQNGITDAKESARLASNPGAYL